MDLDELKDDVSIVFEVEEGFDLEEVDMSDEDIDEDVGEDVEQKPKHEKRKKNKRKKNGYNAEDFSTSNADTRSSMPVFAILAVSWMALMAIPAVTAFGMLDNADIGTSLAIGFVVIPAFLGFLLLFVYMYNRKIKEFNNTDNNAIAKASEPVTSQDDANEGVEECEEYPQDTYSIFAYYCPSENREIFIFALIIIFIQLALLALMNLSVSIPKLRAVGEVDNAEKGWVGIGVFPSNCSEIVRATQVVSIMAYFFFPDASLSDITTAFELFPWSGDKNDPDRAGKLTRLRWSCFFRFLQGMLSAITVWLLVMTSSDVIEIILNFTAVNFISELDDRAFERALEGDYGPSVEKAVEGMKGEKLPFFISKKSKHKRYKYAVSLYTFVLCMSTIAVMVFQNSSKIWVTKTVRVQFDETRSSYNGCYKKTTQKIYDRYIYEGVGNNTAKLGYCLEERRWLFFKGEEKEPCKAYESPDEIAHSAKMDTYDIKMSISEDWFTPSNVPIDDMHFIQNSTSVNSICGGEGIPGDGNCDEFLNNFLYEYDGGDCCAGTCVGDKCGFTDDTEKRYPNCIDPSMTPITIRVDSGITNETSVLKLDCISGKEEYEAFANNSAKEEYEVFAFNNATTIQVDWTEPAMVEIGSICTLYISDSNDNETMTPLSYSIYHGYDNVKGVTGNEAFVMFNTIADQIASFEIPTPIFSRDGKLLPTDLQPFLSVLFFTDRTGAILEKNLDRISTLEDFDLAGNDLTGTIPTDIGHMTSLTKISLYNNQLNGTIPTEIGHMTSLTKIALSTNQLTGPVPNEIGLLKNLTELWLRENELTGPIPTEIGHMKSLTVLRLDNNQLTGPVPNEIGLLKNLTELCLRENELTGPIPTEIGHMKSLTVLRLDNNQLTGTVPTEIGLLTSLEYLYLYNNQLRGTIPTELGLLTRLERIWLHNNDLMGTIPTEIGLLKNLTELFLCDNQLNFTKIPVEVEDLVEKGLELRTSCDADADRAQNVPVEAPFSGNKRETHST